MSNVVDLAVESYENYMGMVSEQVHKNYHACTNKMKEVKALRLQYEREKFAAMKKYNESCQEIYKRINEITTGSSEPNEKEMEGYIPSEEIKPKEDSEFNKGIPAFWFCVLKNSMLFDMANGSEADINVLVHLKNIRVEHHSIEDTKTKEGEDTLKFTHKVHFDFEPNEYFTNETITVSVQCRLCESEGEFEEPVITTETPIEWNKDKDVRYKLVKRRGGKRGGRAKTASVARQKTESFFDLFYTPELPADLNLDDMEEIDEDVIKCHTNFKIFMELIMEVYPMALGFFDESLVDEDDDMDGLDDDDMDDEFDEDCAMGCCGHKHGDEDDDDEDDEDEDGDVPKANLTQPPAPQDCPQQ